MQYKTYFHYDIIVSYPYRHLQMHLLSCIQHALMHTSLYPSLKWFTFRFICAFRVLIISILYFMFLCNTFTYPYRYIIIMTYKIHANRRICIHDSCIQSSHHILVYLQSCPIFNRYVLIESHG